MIEIVSAAGVAMLFFAALWVGSRFRGWHGDRAQLMREVSDLTTHATVLQDHSSQAIVQFETTGLIRTVNPVAEELFGYPADELVGRSILKLVPEALSASRLTETLEIRCKDGSRFRLPFKAAKSDLAPLSYIYLFFEQQSKEAAPPPAQSPLPYAARIVGRIAGQYETLLTTINGYSELALTGTPESSPLRQELEEIMTASHRASALTQHLTAFSGAQILPVEPVNLKHLVEDMRPELREAVPGPIDFDLQPMDRASLANADCLRQVILLLCGSARGRMREADRLQVRTGFCALTGPRLVQSGELKAGTYGALTISDSGRPLSAQFKDHLFEPLYRIHQEMGVDLSPIYGMVRSLGGGIDVVTGEVAGTTFEILLPCVV
jgi:nitrogen-specific signal transduction histidine kinase